MRDYSIRRPFELGVGWAESSKPIKLLSCWAALRLAQPAGLFELARRELQGSNLELWHSCCSGQFTIQDLTPFYSTEQNTQQSPAAYKFKL